MLHRLGPRSWVIIGLAVSLLSTALGAVAGWDGKAREASDLALRRAAVLSDDR